MRTALEYKLNVSLLGKDHVIAVSRDVVRVLGKPEFVRILKNTDKDTIAFQACDEKEILSFKVPEKLFTKGYSSSFRIYSGSFVDEIIQKYNMDNNTRYSFAGQYVELHNAVVFPLLLKTEEKL